MTLSLTLCMVSEILLTTIHLTKHQINSGKIVMKNKNKKIMLSFLFCILFLLSIIDFSQIKAVSSGTIIEDFTSTSYLDSYNSNITGWGTGVLELPRKNPQYLDSIDIGIANHLFIEGNYAYVGTNDGMFIVDISIPTTLNLVGYYNDSAEIDHLYGCVVQNQLAYYANGNDGLFILNVTNLSNPTKKGELALPSVSLDIKLKNQYAYIPVYMGGIRVVDITDPTAPVDVSGFVNVTNDADAYGVAISGNYLYVAISHSGLDVFDISTPSTPVFVSNVDLNGYARKVEIKGNYAYVACDLGGLQIVDISDPANMTRVAWLDDNTRFYGVCVENDLVIVSGVKSPTGYIMKIYNVSVPTNPKAAGFYDLSYTGYDVFVDGDYAFVAATTSGLQSFRIAESGDYYSSHYENFAVAISSIMYTAPVGETIGQCSINLIDMALPTGTKADYYFSVDGANWELCSLSSPLDFQNKGRHLRFKAEFSTNDDALSPLLNYIEIDYLTEDEELIPFYPIIGSYIQETTPNLDWNDISGTPGYLLQLSTSVTFNTLLLNETLLMVESNYTVSTPLAEGEYFWRVGYFIDFSTFGTFSDTWNFHIGEEPIVSEFGVIVFSILIISSISISVIFIRRRNR